jgi:hypothetical protein
MREPSIDWSMKRRVVHDPIKGSASAFIHADGLWHIEVELPKWLVGHFFAECGYGWERGGMTLDMDESVNTGVISFVRSAPTKSEP